MATLERLDEALGLQERLPFPLVLWSVQNTCYEVLRSVYPEMARRARRGDTEALTWLELFQSLGAKLRVLVDIREPASVET